MRKIDGKIVAFLSPVIYYIGYLLKSVNRASVRNTVSRVSLSGVGLRCVGLAQKISARC